MKEWSRGGGEGGRERAEEEGEDGRERAGKEEEMASRLKCSFEILSEKCVANSCGRAIRGDNVGRERFAVLCKMLLIVLQRARGLDDD